MPGREPTMHAMAIIESSGNPPRPSVVKALKESAKGEGLSEAEVDEYVARVVEAVCSEK